MRQVCSTALAAIIAAVVFTAPASAEDPLGTIRSFCRIDGAGVRLSPASWRQVANIVDWRLEPAWDHIKVIYGYEITTPHRDGDRITAEITYYIAADVRAGAVTKRRRTETEALDLVRYGEHMWRIHGPPPLPHVFDYVVDMAELAELLKPESKQYQSASALIWNHLSDQGWDIPYESTEAIPASTHFEEVATAGPGDIAVYFTGATAYHVGVVESEETVLSATLNAGPVEAPFAAFSGTVRYWRPKHLSDGESAETKSARKAISPQRRN